MRAGPRCHDVHVEAGAPDVALIGAKYAPAPIAEPDEPTVYEDLFPVGNMPSEVCTLHDAAANADGLAASSTPMVDSLTGSPSYRPASLQQGAAIRDTTDSLVRGPCPSARRLGANRYPAAGLAACSCFS